MPERAPKTAYDMKRYRRAMRLMWERMSLRYRGVLKHPTAPYYAVPFPQLDDFEKRQDRKPKQEDIL